MVFGALGVALFVYQRAAFGLDERGAPHGAVGAQALGDGGAAEPGCLVEPLPAVGLVGGGGAGPAGEIGHGGASVSMLADDGCARNLRWGKSPACEPAHMAILAVSHR